MFGPPTSEKPIQGFLLSYIILIHYKDVLVYCLGLQQYMKSLYVCSVEYIDTNKKFSKIIPLHFR